MLILQGWLGSAVAIELTTTYRLHPGTERHSLIWGARYDLMMEAFGGHGFYVEDPKDLRGALNEAMNSRGRRWSM